MTRLVSVILMMLIAHTSSSKEYVSLDAPSIFFHEDQMLYVTGDIQGRFRYCEDFDGKCLIMQDLVLIIPDDLTSRTAPSRAVVGDYVLTSLPFDHKYRLLGIQIEGRLVRIATKEDDLDVSSILFSKNQGVLSFSIRGVTYWSSDYCGLFSPKACYGDDK